MTVEMIYVHGLHFGRLCAAVFMQANLLVNQFGERFIDEGQMQNTTFTGKHFYTKGACGVRET
jgi:hypothetical protein